MTETQVVYETETVESQALEISEQAKTLKVLDEETYIEAGEMLRTLKTMKNKVTDFFAPMKAKSYAAWKEICAKENEAVRPLDEADKLVRVEAGKYLEEQERIRKEAQRKAEEEARIAAEKEKQKLLEQAVRAEEKGKAEKAEALLEKAEMVYQEPIAVPSAVQKTTRLEVGSVTRKSDIQVIVSDQFLLVKAIVEKKIPITVVDFKLNTIKSWVKTSGIINGDIPGLIIKEIQGISVR